MSSDYVSNLLNQYEMYSVSGKVELIGEVDPRAQLNVKYESVPDAGIQESGELEKAIQRSGKHFKLTVPVNNKDNPVTTTFSVTAEYRNETTQRSETVLTPKTPVVLEYDDDGNLTRDGQWNYYWNGNNRLVEMISSENSLISERVKLVFDYDYMGRRKCKRYYVFDEESNRYTIRYNIWYVYDGWNIVMEIRDENGVTNDTGYLWGLDISGSLQTVGGAGGLLSVKHSDESSILPFYDGNGNVTGLYSENEILEFYEYDPFGRIIGKENNYNDFCSFKFSTKYKDIETDIYYYGKRYYCDSTGGWLNRDPIEENGGINLYAFLSNNVINYIDFLGLYEYDWKTELSDEQKKQIMDSVNRVKTRAEKLIKQIDNEIKKHSVCTCSGYDMTISNLNHLKGVLQGMVNNIKNPRLNLEIYVKNLSPGTSGTFWDNGGSWLFDEELTLDVGWFKSDEKHSTMFHEISHGEGTDDKNEATGGVEAIISEYFNNAHEIEKLYIQDLKDWKWYKESVKLSREKCIE